MAKFFLIPDGPRLLHAGRSLEIEDSYPDMLTGEMMGRIHEKLYIHLCYVFLCAFAFWRHCAKQFFAS